MNFTPYTAPKTLASRANPRILRRGATVRVNGIPGRIVRVIRNLDSTDPATGRQQPIPLRNPLYEISLDLQRRRACSLLTAHVPDGVGTIKLFADEFLLPARSA